MEWKAQVRVRAQPGDPSRIAGEVAAKIKWTRTDSLCRPSPLKFKLLHQSPTNLTHVNVRMGMASFLSQNECPTKMRVQTLDTLRVRTTAHAA